MAEKTTVGFIVYGVHKDGLRDPMGAPFIDEALVARALDALRRAGLEPVTHDVVVSTKAEARECFRKFRGRDDVAALVLFTGTWAWAAHLVAALRDVSLAGKGIVIWTHPGSQGWRTVGGLVMHGALNEIGVPHRFVYGSHDDPACIQAIASYCRAALVRGSLVLSTAGVWGGRGMGQTVGCADPSQWMRMFGIDIDTRDSAELIATAQGLDEGEVGRCREKVQRSFHDTIPRTPVADRSLRLLGAIEKLVEREGWDFYAIQSFPGIADAYSATSLAQSMMLEWGVPTSTLGDLNTLLTVAVMMRLGAGPVYYGDLQHIDRDRREIKIIGDGACPPSLAGAAGPARLAEHGIPSEGNAGGLSVDLVCREGAGVLARLGRIRGELAMVALPCRVFEPGKEEIRRRREECHIPFWPHAFVSVDCEIEELVQSWNNEYAVLGYGTDILSGLRDFCELTGVTFKGL